MTTEAIDITHRSGRRSPAVPDVGGRPGLPSPASARPTASGVDVGRSTGGVAMLGDTSTGNSLVADLAGTCSPLGAGQFFVLGEPRQ